MAASALYVCPQPHDHHNVCFWVNLWNDPSRLACEQGRYAWTMTGYYRVCTDHYAHGDGAPPENSPGSMRAIGFLQPRSRTRLRRPSLQFRLQLVASRDCVRSFSTSNVSLTLN